MLARGIWRNGVYKTMDILLSVETLEGIFANSSRKIDAISYSTAGFPESPRTSTETWMDSMAMCNYLRTEINRTSWMIGWNTRTMSFGSTIA